MKTTLWIILCGVLGLAGTAPAAIIDFTGGTATLNDGTTVVTDNSAVYGPPGWGDPGTLGVDYYDENGFRLDFVGDDGIIGDYYHAGNAVIHAHWGTGAYGSLTSIMVTKIDGTPFDLNYFVLTSNTDTGGAAPSGNEQAWINSSNGFSLLLPPDTWGFAGANPQIFLDANFDNIAWFSFTVSNSVDCFGMDNFYIDEPAPGVPAPGALVLGSLGMGLAGWLRRHRIV